MADDDKLSDVNLTYGRPAQEEGVSWSNYLKGMQSGAASQIVGGIAAIAEDLAGDSRFGALAGDVRNAANTYAQDKLAETSPKFQRRAAANFFHGDGPSIWEEGVAGSLLAKAAISAPSIIATAVPGGMVGRAFMSARAGLVAAQASGGVLTAGSIVNEIYKEFDKLPDAKLMETSPVYAGYRSMGMTEEQARSRVREDVAGVEPYLVGAISALIPGAEGAIASRLGGRAAAGSYLGTAAKRATGEAAQEFTEEGAGEIAQQRALQPFNLSDLDWMKALEAGVQGTAIGAPLGGVSGVAERIGGGMPKDPGADPQVTQEVNLPEPETGLDTGAVDPAQKVALDTKLNPTAAVTGTAPPASPVDPNAVSTRKQATPKQLERAKQKAAAKEAAQPPVETPTPAPAPAAAPVTQQVSAPAVETPEQEAARLATELSPGIDPAAATALEAKAAPVPAPPEQEAAQLVKDLTQPAAQSVPVAANPVPSVPPVSSVQEGPVAAGTPAVSPEVRTPPQEQNSTTVEPPSTQTPYDRAIALIESGTPITSVNAVQMKVNTGYKTAVKLFARLKAEGKVGEPVPRPQKAVSRPVEAPPAAAEGAPATTLPAAESARPEAPVIDAQPVTQEVTEAPKAAELKKKSNRTKPSDVRVFTEEEKKAYVEAAAREAAEKKAAEAEVEPAPAGARRILKEATPEAIAKAEENTAGLVNAIVRNRTLDTIKKDASKQAEEDEDKSSDSNASRARKRAKQSDEVMNIIKQATPTKLTAVRNAGDVLALEARLSALLSEARRRGIGTQKLVNEGTPTPLYYLSHVNSFLKKVAKAKAEDKLSGMVDEANMFLSEEFDVREGDGRLMRERRMEEGDQTSRVTQTSEKAEKIGWGADLKPDESEKEFGVDDDTGDKVSIKDERENNETGDDEPDVEIAPRERAPVKIEEDAVRGYAGVKEGSVKTEKVVGGRKKLGVVVNVPKGVSILKKAPQLDTQQVTAEATTGVDGKPLANTGAVTQGVSTETYFEPSDVAEMLGWVRSEFGKQNSAVDTSIHSMISKRVADLVGDVEIHVLPADDMKQLYADPGGEIANGLYYPDLDLGDDKGARDVIYINENTVRNRSAHYVILHEAIHAATYRVMANDADLLSEVRTLMSFMEQTHGNAYALKNEYEFIAEAMSNPDFQRAMQNTILPADIAAQYGLNVGRRLRSAWDWFLNSVRRALGLPAGTFSVFDATMRVGDYILTEAENNAPSNVVPFNVLPSIIGDTMRQFTQRVTNTPVTEDELVSDAGPKLMAVRTFDNISRAADQYFGGAENNPVRVAQEVVEKMRVHGQDVFEKSTPLIEALYKLEKKYSGKQWDTFAELSHDATMLNVHPDKPLTDPANAHLSKRKDAQAIAEWQRLNARFNSLPDELKAAWGKTTGYYRDMQNAMAFSILKNRVLKSLAGDMSEAELDAIARRYFNSMSTEADTAKLGKELDSALKAIDELKSIKGPYFPQMRRGDWAVLGRVAYTKPVNAKAIDGTTYSFKDEKAATDYVNKVWRESGIKATVKRQYVDPATGLTYFTDDDGEKVKASSKEPAAEKRFLVSVQDEFLEYHATQSEAEARAAEIGKTMKKVAVEERRVQPQARGELYSEQLRSVMKRIEQKDAYKSLTPEARAETVRALNELSFQLFGATRIQSRRLPRRYVAGASKDVTRNAMEYAQSVSGYIGKLRYQPELDAAVKKMHDYIETNRYQDRQRTVARSRIANEVDRRLSAPPAAAISRLDHGIQRVLTVSFLDKLATLSYSVVNSTQTITNTMPLLASRHGWARSTKAMTQAYSMIGGARNIGTGVANTGRALKVTQQVSLLDPVRSRLAKHGSEYVQLFDYLRERGVVSSDAGMEVIKAVKNNGGFWGGVDKTLSYGDSIARALPEAVEVNNRVASAVASYMLARAKNMSVDQARRYAYDVVNGTQFNYSQTNAPAFMNNPMARLIFQFKKYAQGQYQLLGEQVGKVLHGASRQEKIEGVKALVNFAATTMVFAGALGLPTEPIKYMLMAASAFGLGYSYDDLERDVRKKAAEWMGSTAGEMFTRGVTRGLPAGFAFDLSSKMGLDNLTSFGQPRENSMDAWNAWLWKQVSGAPVSLGTDMIRGVNLIATGEFQKGVELMLPFKQAADALTSYRLATEGKKSGVTGRQTLDPLNAAEVTMRTLGFRPGREAETLERDNAYYTVKKERMGERQRLVSKWLNTTGDERAAIWKQIVKYNAGVEEVSRITMGQLTTAQKRRKSEERRGTIVDGKRVTKDDRAIYDTGNIYNVR